MTDTSGSPTPPIIVLAGPTAVGKTALSLAVAREFGCEIIGVDSVQVYKYLDIGSAKPSHAERQTVPHHLIDYVDPAADYNASIFVRDAEKAVQQVISRGNIPLMTGGTGLYYRTFFEGLCQVPQIDESVRKHLQDRIVNEGTAQLHKELQRFDPTSAMRIHKNDTSRLIRALEIYHGTGTTWTSFIASQKEEQSAPGQKWRVVKVCLHLEREVLYERINHRVELMFDAGLEGEVESLLQRGYTAQLPALQTLGYRHVIQLLQGAWSRSECIRLLKRDTRRYAKRQLTWFRRDAAMRWFSPLQEEEVLCYIEQQLKCKNG